MFPALDGSPRSVLNVHVPLYASHILINGSRQTLTITDRMAEQPHTRDTSDESTSASGIPRMLFVLRRGRERGAGI